MAADVEPDSKLKIAHVLNMDIVGYLTLLITEQSQIMSELTHIVRSTARFRQGECEGKLLRIPTGDGMALVFFNDPEAPIECAMEVTAALKTHPEIRLRMGIHSGPVNQVVDVNDRSNVAGAGIDMVQRVMDCGDAGHILLSKRVADDLAPHPRWNPYLHDLGECEVKHGRRISLVNFYTNELGNKQLPEKLSRGQQEQAAIADSRPTATLRQKHFLIAGGALLITASAIAVWFYSRQPTVTLPPPEKSIAVLPFENLSHDPDNAYFAEGMQEEILTRLAKIADLKVISRTSTQRYKSVPENLAEIARQLGVAHILEGSVQRSGDVVRVNVQLINAENDSHLWGESYDGRLTDIFAVESEIATNIADMLQAKLTARENRAISGRPTDNPVAYEDYLKGRYFWNKRTGNDFKTAITYFQQAIDNDPGFGLAYAGLADTYVLLPAFTWAAPPDAMPKAKVAAQKALELDNTLAEAHTSLAMVLRAYDFDYNQATTEFKRAIELNANYAPARYWFGTHVLSALNRFNEAIAEVKRALELDPLSLVANVDLGVTYVYARQFDDAIDQLRKAVELDNNFSYAHGELGVALECKGLIDAAIGEFESAYRLNDDPVVFGLLGHAYAVRGRRDDALKLLAQLKEESARSYVPAYSFAIIYLGLGDKDEALGWLEKDFSDRDGWNIGFIKVDPMLDPLRGNPRFEALAEKIIPAREFKSAATNQK
jgi:TolB-like protein/Flp pilus assembly protein TadD